MRSQRCKTNYYYMLFCTFEIAALQNNVVIICLFAIMRSHICNMYSNCTLVFIFEIGRLQNAQLHEFAHCWHCKIVKSQLLFCLHFWDRSFENTQQLLAYLNLWDLNIANATGIISLFTFLGTQRCKKQLYVVLHFWDLAVANKRSN